MKIRSQILLNVKHASVVMGEDGLPAKIQVLPQGDFKTPYHGNFELDAQDLQEYATNFNAGYRASGGLPINFDHNDGPAAGWITNLFVGDDGFLWADVDWTDLGKDALNNKQYRFISPEFCPEYENPQKAGDYTENVLVGAGLTNTPLFTQLKPLVANNKNEKSQQSLTDKGSSITIYADEGEPSMNLDDLRVKDAANLTDEERKFLADNKDQLTADEQNKFGFAEPKEEAAPVAPEGEVTEEVTPEAAPVAEVEASESVKISASELRELKAAAQAGKDAFDKLRKKEATDKVKVLVASGRIKASQQDKAAELLMKNAELESFLNDLPENKIVTAGEAGSAEKGNIGDAYASLTEMTKAKMAADGIGFVDAFRQVVAANPDTAKQYDSELQMSTNNKGI